MADADRVGAHQDRASIATPRAAAPAPGRFRPALAHVEIRPVSAHRCRPAPAAHRDRGTCPCNRCWSASVRTSLITCPPSAITTGHVHATWPGSCPLRRARMSPTRPRPCQRVDLAGDCSRIDRNIEYAYPRRRLYARVTKPGDGVAMDGSSTPRSRPLGRSALPRRCRSRSTTRDNYETTVRTER